MLGERIGRMRGKMDPTPRREEHYSQVAMAWRMVIELVVGLVIGFVIGYGLDALLGTRPLLMVAFILLGFAAGIRTMLRTAREIQAEQSGGPGADERRAGSGEGETET